MTMLEIYKSRKDALALRLKESKSLYETGSVLSEAFETIQYQYLSQADNDKLTDQVTALVNMAKSTFPMLASVNKYKLWEKAESGKEPKKKSMMPGFIAFLIGAAMVLGSAYIFRLQLVKMLADTTVTGFDGYGKIHFYIMAAGCLVMFVAGFMMFFRKKVKLKATVEIAADPDDLLKKLEDVVANIDAMLDAVKAEKAKNAETLANAVATSINADEIQLFSYLMEAKYSGEADFAMEQLEEVEHYLAKQDVLLVNYTKGNEKYFDFLEGDVTKTIRPALIRKGEVLTKGLAQFKGDMTAE